MVSCDEIFVVGELGGRVGEISPQYGLVPDVLLSLPNLERE